MEDIDLEESPWAPIGNQTNISYSGTFNGNGHTISALYVAVSTGAGMFGYVGDDGKLQNVYIKDGKIDLRSGENIVYAGGVCGYNMAAP